MWCWRTDPRQCNQLRFTFCGTACLIYRTAGFDRLKKKGSFRAMAFALMATYLRALFSLVNNRVSQSSVFLFDSTRFTLTTSTCVDAPSLTGSI